MQLPARDVSFLTERGFQWELIPDPNGAACLVIKDFQVGPGGFAPPVTDLMIRIPGQYPLTPLDMWYCSPAIRIAATGQFAPASEVSEQLIGRSWQRFSRHLPGTWQPGTDSLRSFLALIQRELQGR